MAKKRKSPYNHPTIETHPRRQEMLEDLSDGMPMSKVATKYGVSRITIAKYVKEYLWPMAAAKYKEEQHQGGTAIKGRVERMVEVAEKMLESVDEQLTDPDNPGRYDLSPKAEEIEVTYIEDKGRGPKRRKARLQELIDQVEQNERAVVSLHSRQPDLKELLLKSVDSLERALTLLAKIEGSLQDPSQLDLTMFPVWKDIQIILMEVSKDHPQARETIVAELEKLSQ